MCARFAAASRCITLGELSGHIVVRGKVIIGNGGTEQEAARGYVAAYDAETGKLAWRFYIVPGNPADGKFFAYQAQTGEPLWLVDVGSGISAPPITYSVDGKQYISLSVGWGGACLIAGTLAAQHGWAYKKHPRRLLTFALDSTLPMPASPPPYFPTAIDDPGFAIDEALAQHGLSVYSQSCFLCHGGGAVSGGYAPDLRASELVLSRAAFDEVVRKGAKMAAGMPRFPEFSAREVDGLMHYVRQQARRALTKN